jgi:hypothetical protein
MNQTLLPSANERAVLKDGLLKPGSTDATDAGAKVRQGVRDAAHKAFGANSFKDRNDGHATAVGKESALLAAHSMGKPQALERVAPMFIKAAKDAGQAFAAAFAPNGKPIAGRDGKPTKEATDAYNAALKAAGGVALAALKQLDAGADKAIKGANLADIAALVARDLGLDDKTAARFSSGLKGTLTGLKLTALKDDSSRDLLDTLPLGDKPALDDAARDTVGLGVRLADCTRRSGEVHRAAWEGDPSRLEPDKGGGVFDVLHAQKFHAGGANAESFALAVFEVYKDLNALQKAAG